MSFQRSFADPNFPLALCLINLSLFAAAFFAFLGWLYQPNVIENPGIAAYRQPPGTRLVPLPRKMDAPELVEIPEAVRHTASLAYDNNSRDTVDQKDRPRVSKPKPRQKIVTPSSYGETAFAYQRQRTGFRELSGGRYNSWF